VFVVSFAVRSLYAVDLAPLMGSHAQPGTRMAARYDARAAAILDGQGILFPAVWPEPSDTALIARPPGYPLFLAAVYAACGRSFFPVQLVQNLLTSAAAALAVDLVAGLLGLAAGLGAAPFVALSSHLAYASNCILADAPSALPVVLAMTVLVGADPEQGLAERLQPWRTALAGLLVGLGVWLRPNLMLMGCFLAVALLPMFRPWRRALPGLALLAAVSVAAFFPITLRNRLVWGEWVAVSTNGGLTLLEGVAAAGDKVFTARTRDKLVTAEEAVAAGRSDWAETWVTPDGIRRDRERYALAWAEIRKRPLWYGRAMAGRIVEMLTYQRGGPPHVAAQAAEAPEAAGAWLAPGRALGLLRPLVGPLQRTIEVLALPLAVLGLVATLRTRPRSAAFLLIVPAYCLLLESMFVYEWRVIVPMHGFVFGFSGAGLAALAALVQRALRGRPPSPAPGLPG
jgi:hypothetical protein